VRENRWGEKSEIERGRHRKREREKERLRELTSSQNSMAPFRIVKEGETAP